VDGNEPQRALRIGFVDGAVEQDFAGALTVADKDVSIEIGKADVGGLQGALAHHRGRAEKIAGAKPGTDVASVAVNVLPLPELAAHGDDLGAKGFGQSRFGGQRMAMLQGAGSRQGPTARVLSRGDLSVCSITKFWSIDGLALPVAGRINPARSAPLPLVQLKALGR